MLASVFSPTACLRPPDIIRAVKTIDKQTVFNLILMHKHLSGLSVKDDRQTGPPSLSEIGSSITVNFWIVGQKRRAARRKSGSRSRLSVSRGRRGGVFMNIKSILTKKRDGGRLSREEIRFFVRGYVDGSIPDYQASALLTSVFIRGMDDRETTDLTLEMADSGDKLDLSAIPGIKVDKHSTGGVGDKVTLITLPMVASLGIPVAKLSGRGLGSTGGTIDKLHSIPGMRTDLAAEEFIGNVKSLSMALMEQTADLCPADKKLYALRDVTATVDSIPLIASSVMSKKIAAGAQKILLEVTCGSGSFMKTRADAEKLAGIMVRIGRLAGRETTAVITGMDQPLGCACGNAVEIIETVEALKGNGSRDVMEVCLEIGAHMLRMAEAGDDLPVLKERLLGQIRSGKALDKFREFIQSQGGDASFIEDPSALPAARGKEIIRAEKDGYISSINGEALGNAVVAAGGGRIKKEDAIDYSAGLLIHRKIGDQVKAGDPLYTVLYNDPARLKAALEASGDAYRIGGEPVPRPAEILGVIAE